MNARTRQALVGSDYVSFADTTRQCRQTYLNCIDIKRSRLSYMCTSRIMHHIQDLSWWRHQMEIFSALLALCSRNLPVTGEFLSQRPVARSFDVFFDLSWWYEAQSRSLWRHCNDWPGSKRWSYIPWRLINTRATTTIMLTWVWLNSIYTISYPKASFIRH